MTEKSNIVLVGMMGSGKSTVGRVLSDMHDLQFVDTDKEIERSSGKKISDIFAESGEAAFREMECDYLKTLSHMNHVVISTGGGILTRPGNADLVKASGVVIYLHSSPETLLKRLKNSMAKRPLLSDSHDPLLTLQRLYSERDANYRNAAQHVIETDGETPKSIAKRIKGLVSA